MPWNFTNDRPIFQQIADIIVSDVVSGRYKPGEKLPTVRDIALTAGVNPNTMQRAFVETETRGIIVTKRGDGRYVTDDTTIIKDVATKLLSEMTKNFVTSALELGFNNEEISAIVKSHTKEI